MKFYIKRKVKEPEILEEMAHIGYIDNYEIIVWTNDAGNIPHFHIRDFSTKGGKFHTCIRIDEPKYFHHTGKEDKLNSKDKKNLIKFLNDKPEDGVFESNWKLLVYMWNLNNSKRKIFVNQEMPDYKYL